LARKAIVSPRRNQTAAARFKEVYGGCRRDG
jgi:hypothetical protein